jgi:hypothetical protein
VSSVDLQTWVSIGSLLAVGVAIVGAFTRQTGGLKADIAGLRTELKGDIAGLRTELKGDIAGLRAELKGDIAGLRAEMKAEFGGVESRLNGLDQRTFELSTRLPPLSSRPSGP